jgi:dihydrolipoamide dehydrogenase
MEKKSFDVVVIGGGPGGYVAAIRAAQLGLKPCVIEKEKLGGVCLNWGCIPTKALLRSAEVAHLIQNSSKYGIEIEGKIKIDFKGVIERSRGVSEQLSNGIKTLMRKHNIEVIYGHGKLLGKKKVVVEGTSGNKIELIGNHIILATGARPRTLPNVPIDNKFVWDYKDAMISSEVPQNLVIIGAGAIGIEYASFYNDMGSNVMVVEAAPRILMSEDEEIATLAKKELEKAGIKIITGASIDSFSIKDERISISVNKQSMEFNKVISAAGVIPNTENLGIENTKIKLTQSGHITTNEWMETDELGIYAIGDITQPPFLAHKASHEGIVCVEKIAGLPTAHPIHKKNIPGCVYSRPQVASIGLSEKAAKDAGYEINVGRFPFIGNGKAIAIGEPQGLIKTIFDKKTGEILGVHMIGAEVTELINSFAVAKTGELTDLDIMRSIFPHPTLSEMLHESVLASRGNAIHI